METDENIRIKTWVAVILVLTAFTVDLIEMLLEWMAVGLILNIITIGPITLLFWLWFKMLNVPFIASPKKFFTLSATCLAEIIPALDAVGGFFWTLGTIIIIVMVRMEDKGGIAGKLSGTTMSLMRTRYTANKKLFNTPGNAQQVARNLRKNNPDLIIKPEELITETMKNNKKPNKDEYERGIDELKSNIKNVLNLKQKEEHTKNGNV